MQSNYLSQEELMNFAHLLFGDKWRDELSQHLDISRKQLVLTLASGDPVPEKITVPFLSLMEDHLRRQEEASRKIQTRITQIRRSEIDENQSRVVRKSAS